MQVCSVRAKICQFHSLWSFLQQAEGYCLPKVWNASYKCSLIYGQAAGLAYSVTVEFPREVQTCNWTEGRAVHLMKG
jgi:hypothetical protein